MALLLASPSQPATPTAYFLVAIAVLAIMILPAYIIVRIVPAIKRRFSGHDQTQHSTRQGIYPASLSYQPVIFMLNNGVPVKSKDGGNSGVKFKKVLEHQGIANAKEGNL